MLFSSLLVAACGEAEPARQAKTPPPIGAPVTTATATATASATPAATATTTPAATATPTPPATSSAEAQEGGAGDEEGARTQIAFTVDGEGITPPSVEVPAFIAWELKVRNDLPDVVRLKLGADTFGVAGNEEMTTRLPGRRPGRYTLDAGASGKAVIVVGG